MNEPTVLWQAVRKTGTVLRFEVTGKSGFFLNLYAQDGSRIAGMSIALRDMPSLVCVMVRLIGQRVGGRDAVEVATSEGES